MSDIFPGGIPHNGSFVPGSTDSLLRVHSKILRQKNQTVDEDNIITGVRGWGEYVQVGRNALPLFNAGLVGTQRQTKPINIADYFTFCVSVHSDIYNCRARFHHIRSHNVLFANGCYDHIGG